MFLNCLLNLFSGFYWEQKKVAFEFLCGCKDCDHQTRKVKDLSLIPYYFDEVKKWYDGVKAVSFDLVEMWV